MLYARVPPHLPASVHERERTQLRAGDWVKSSGTTRRKFLGWNYDGEKQWSPEEPLPLVDPKKLAERAAYERQEQVRGKLFETLQTLVTEELESVLADDRVSRVEKILAIEAARLSLQRLAKPLVIMQGIKLWERVASLRGGGAVGKEKQDALRALGIGATRAS